MAKRIALAAAELASLRLEAPWRLLMAALWALSHSPWKTACLTIQEGGDAEEPPPLSEAERRDGATPRGDDVPSYSARDRGGDGPKQKQHAAARAASGAERVLPETTWTGTGPPDEQPPAGSKQPKAKPRKEALLATYLY